ncbi:hypothetical protein Tco_0886897 [Tanacetum coccineum]
MSDSQNELREFYKTDVILMSIYLYKTLSEIKEELIEKVQEMLNFFESMEQKDNGKSPTKIPLQNEIDRLLEVSLRSEIRDYVLLLVEQQKHELLKVKLEKSASDSRDIQANLLKRIKILEDDFQRSQAQSIKFELKLQHQKEKMACDVSWKAKLSTFHDENVLLKQQVKSSVKERENIKLEFQKLFNSIKETRAQHQHEINEIFEDVTQKTYAYADVRAQNQDLLMTISELKSKVQTIDKGKHVNTKFDKSETLGQLLCVTPFNKNLVIKAKNVSNTKVTSDRSNPITSQSIPTTEKKQQHNANVIERGMKSTVKRALFTSPVAATSKSLGATSVVAKSRFSVAKTPTATNKNRSIVYTWHNKTLYELIHGRKPNVQYFHVFGSLCYLTNDRDDLGKMKPKADIDLDNLLSPMYEEYYMTSSQEVSDNSAANTLDNDHTSSSSSIVVDQDDAPPIVVSSEEQDFIKSNSPVLNEVSNEFVQDITDFDGNTFHNAPQTPEFDVAESSSTS